MAIGGVSVGAVSSTCMQSGRPSEVIRGHQGRERGRRSEHLGCRLGRLGRGRSTAERRADKGSMPTVLTAPGAPIGGCLEASCRLMAAGKVTSRLRLFEYWLEGVERTPAGGGGRSDVIRRAIRGQQEGNQRSSGGQSEVIRRAIRGHHPGSSGRGAVTGAPWRARTCRARTRGRRCHTSSR